MIDDVTRSYAGGGSRPLSRSRPPPPKPDGRVSRPDPGGGTRQAEWLRVSILRIKIVEAVIALITDVGADAVQMRNVAQQSGVALGTVYRYFSSKEHLLAAALEDWQKRLTRRVTASGDPGEGTPLPRILDYLERARRAFHRNPKMTALMLQAMTSNDPRHQDRP